MKRKKKKKEDCGAHIPTAAVFRTDDFEERRYIDGRAKAKTEKKKKKRTNPQERRK